MTATSPSGRLVVGSDDRQVLGAVRSALEHTDAGRLLAWVSVADPAGLPGLVLSAALAALPPDEAGGAAVFLAADEYCVEAATTYARRCADTGRRLRPSDSIRLETSELVRPLGGSPGRTGPCYVLTSPGSATAQGEALARAVTRENGRPAAVVCEVLRDGPDGPYLVTALVLRSGDTPARTATPAALPGVVPPPQADADRSLVVRSRLLALSRREVLA